MICHMPGCWRNHVEELMWWPELGILVIETNNVHRASQHLRVLMTSHMWVCQSLWPWFMCCCKLPRMLFLVTFRTGFIWLSGLSFLSRTLSGWESFSSAWNQWHLLSNELIKCKWFWNLWFPQYTLFLAFSIYSLIFDAIIWHKCENKFQSWRGDG